MIWYLYILQNRNHKSTPVTIYSYKICCDENFLKIYCLSNFQICNTILLTIVTMLYITFPSLYLFYNWKFIHFDPLYPFCSPPHSSLLSPFFLPSFFLSFSLLLFSLCSSAWKISLNASLTHWFFPQPCHVYWRAH